MVSILRSRLPTLTPTFPKKRRSKKQMKMMNHHNQDRRNLAFRQSLFRSLFPNFWSALLGRVAHFFCLRRYVYQLLKVPFYKFYKFYTLKYSALHFLRCSTFFYKVLQTTLRNTDFLHFSIISTLFLFCRKYSL